MWHWLNVEFWGPMWPNMFAPSVITLIAVVISHLKARRHRDRQMAQAERHHTEATAQRTAHQNELKHQAERHHLQALDRLEAHHEALKAHITAQGRPVSSVPLGPQQVEEVLKAAERTKRSRPPGDLQ